MTLKEQLAMHREDIGVSIKGLNTMFAEGKPAKEIDEAEQKLKKLETAFAATKFAIIVEEFAKEESPLKAALSVREYGVISHKAVRENGQLLGYSLVEDTDEHAKVRTIDLLDVCKQLKLSTAWELDVQTLNLWLTVNTALELGNTMEQITRVNDSYNMSKLAKRFDVKDKKVVSNTQTCKKIQECIDGILFIDNGNGQNVIKANNRDFAYLKMCYTRRVKACGVKVADHKELRKLIADIMFRILTNGVYTVDYKVAKKVSL